MLEMILQVLAFVATFVLGILAGKKWFQTATKKLSQVGEIINSLGKALEDQALTVEELKEVVAKIKELTQDNTQ